MDLSKEIFIELDKLLPQNSATKQPHTDVVVSRYSLDEAGTFHLLNMSYSWSVFGGSSSLVWYITVLYNKVFLPFYYVQFFLKYKWCCISGNCGLFDTHFCIPTWLLYSYFTFSLFIFLCSVFFHDMSPLLPLWIVLLFWKDYFVYLSASSVFSSLLDLWYFR